MDYILKVTFTTLPKSEAKYGTKHDGTALEGTRRRVTQRAQLIDVTANKQILETFDFLTNKKNNIFWHMTVRAFALYACLPLSAGS